MEMHIYITVDSRSVRKSEKKFGYVLACTMNGQLYTREGFGKTEATYNQATLQAMIAALQRVTKPSEICIHSENEFVLNMLENNLEGWATGGYMTAKGTPIANTAEWMQIWELTEKHLISSLLEKHEFADWLKSEMERKM